MLDSAFPEPAEKESQPPVRGSMSGFQWMLESIEHGGTENISDHVHHTLKPVERVVDIPVGFDGQLEAALGSAERGCNSPQRYTASFLKDEIRKMEARIIARISGMLKDGNQRMLRKDESYIASKPTKSIFDEIYKPRMQNPKTEIADGETFQTVQNFEVVNVTRRGDKLITSLHRPESSSVAKVLANGQPIPFLRGFFEKAVLAG